MAVTHCPAPRALVAVALCLALLVGSLAHADEPAAGGQSSPSKYVVVPVLATAVLVVVIALVQAARAPTRDVRLPNTALHALDRALAGARGPEAGYTTRWWAPTHQGPARLALASVRAPGASTSNVGRRTLSSTR
jgi:hypothetical protein